MSPLTQNVREDERIAPWNDNNTTEFEGLRLSGWLRLSCLGIYTWADKYSLQDQGKQQIYFFVIHFHVKYSDRLVTTVHEQFLSSDSWGFWDLSDCHCSFVRSLCHLWHLSFFLDALHLFYTTHGSRVCFLTLFRLPVTKNLDHQPFLFCLVF